MNGTDLLGLRRDLGLTQEEGRVAAGIVNRGTLVEVERNGIELSQEEYQRIADAFRKAASKKQRMEVMA